MSGTFSEPAVGRTPGNRELFAKERLPADSHVKTVRKKAGKRDVPARADRPGWIPREIRHNWDTSPYAYQTEEELMPAGGLHGELLTYLAEILRDFLERKGLRFLADTFMLYRDAKGVKQRIAPDLLIMPYCSPPPSAYDLDKEPPPPAVAEITSPKSRSSDMEKKVIFYGSLSIPAYLAIDQVTDRGDPREQIGLHLWRKTGDKMCRVSPDEHGWLTVPEMKIKIKAQGQNLLLADMETGEELCDSSTLRQRAEMERQRADQEKQTAEMERQRADQERQRAERLADKLRSLGISPE